MADSDAQGPRSDLGVPEETSGGAVAVVVGLGNIPEAIRSLDTIANPDYAEVHTATTSAATDKSPEQWARAVLEETPFSRRFTIPVWRAIGVRLGPLHSPDYVQGWKIAARGDDWIRLEVDSWYMTAHAIVQVDDGRVSLALFLRYDRPVAPLVWSVVSVAHGRAVPAMLRQAVGAHDRSGRRDR